MTSSPSSGRAPGLVSEGCAWVRRDPLAVRDVTALSDDHRLLDLAAIPPCRSFATWPHGCCCRRYDPPDHGTPGCADRPTGIDLGGRRDASDRACSPLARERVTRSPILGRRVALIGPQLNERRQEVATSGAGNYCLGWWIADITRDASNLRACPRTQTCGFPEGFSIVMLGYPGWQNDCIQ